MLPKSFNASVFKLSLGAHYTAPQVIDVVGPVMSGSRALGPGGGILRAKFSAVTPADLAQAFSRLSAPNRCEADAVTFRQELDLRLGVAFSRFQTLHFRDRYSKSAHSRWKEDIISWRGFLWEFRIG